LGAIEERRRCRCPALQSPSCRVAPPRFARDSQFLERLTQSVDPCRLGDLRLVSTAVRITKTTKVDDTEVETRFFFQCSVAAFFSTTIHRVVSRALPDKTTKHSSGVSYCRIVARITQGDIASLEFIRLLGYNLGEALCVSVTRKCEQ
jgi:hypothetical protein